MTSPTKHSLDKLRAEEWTVQVVERWNAFAHVRQDLYGFIDILAIHPQLGFLGVQTTVAGEINRRMDKIRSEPRALTFLLAGGKIVVHGWRKGGPRGQRKTWICREEKITLDNYV